MQHCDDGNCGESAPEDPSTTFKNHPILREHAGPQWRVTRRQRLFVWAVEGGEDAAREIDHESEVGVRLGVRVDGLRTDVEVREFVERVRDPLVPGGAKRVRAHLVKCSLESGTGNREKKY